MNSEVFSSGTDGLHNAENIVPGSQIPPVHITSKVEKPIPTERAALTSLLNLELSKQENNPVSSFPVELDRRPNELVCTEVGPIITEAVVPIFPVQGTERDSQNISPALEEKSIGTLIVSSTESSWNSCTDQLQSPKQEQCSSSNENTCSGNVYDTAEDISNCSLDEIPSSKEVSFNLNLEGSNCLNRTFDTVVHAAATTEPNTPSPSPVQAFPVVLGDDQPSFPSDPCDQRQTGLEVASGAVESVPLESFNAESDNPVTATFKDSFCGSIVEDEISKEDLVSSFSAVKPAELPTACDSEIDIDLADLLQKISIVDQSFDERLAVNKQPNNLNTACTVENPVPNIQTIDLKKELTLENLEVDILPESVFDSTFTCKNTDIISENSENYGDKCVVGPILPVLSILENDAAISDEVNISLNSIPSEQLFETVQSTDELELKLEKVQPTEELELKSEIVQPTVEQELKLEIVQPTEELELKLETVLPNEELELKLETVLPNEELELKLETVLPNEELELKDHSPELELLTEEHSSTFNTNSNCEQQYPVENDLEKGVSNSLPPSYSPDNKTIDISQTSDKSENSVEFNLQNTVSVVKLESNAQEFALDTESLILENNCPGVKDSGVQIPTTLDVEQHFDRCTPDESLTTECVLNDTNNLFSDYSVGLSKCDQNLNQVKSLLDSTFTLGNSDTAQENCANLPLVSENPCANSLESDIPLDTDVVNIVEEQLEPIVLDDIPTHLVAHKVDELQCTSESSELTQDFDNITNCFPSKDLFAKESLSKDLVNPSSNLSKSVVSLSVEESDPSRINEQTLECMVPSVIDIDSILVAMPTPKMEAQIDQQWHPDQLTSDDNRSVDVNVNPCPKLEDTLHDANVKIANHVNSETSVDINLVTSSPNKRKNEEDSAFEDFVTHEDTNSDLVDDHLMDDEVEEIGVAAVSRRSPARTKIPEKESVAKQQSEKPSIPTPEPALRISNQSEAGPEVAEFTEEEFRSAAEIFKDPSTFEFLQRAGNTKALEESSLSRLSLYVKFDPLVAQKSPDQKRHSLFKKPVAPQKKSSTTQEGPSAELISFSLPEASNSPPASRRDTDANQLIELSPNIATHQVTKVSPKMVPVEPVQRIENLDSKKVFSEDDLKKALQINDLLFQERLIKKDKEIAEKERNFAAQLAAVQEKSNSLHQAVIFTRSMLEESGRMMRKWQEKKELERVQPTRERDQALEDLQNVEASFSELHRRYEKIKGVLEGYKQNEEGLRTQLLDTQDKLRNQEEKYDALRGLTQEKLESANTEIENAKKAGGSEIAVLRSQLMKAEMKISSLERSLDQKAQEFAQLTDIYDDLIARVSGSQET